MTVTTRELYTSDPYVQAETHLMSADWEQLVAGIDFADVVAPMSYRKHEPLEHYRLAPIWGTASRRTGPRSSDFAYFSNDFPDDVYVRYWNEEISGELTELNWPPLDTQRGIMLVYKDRGIAVAAACIDDAIQGDQPARLLIKECQGLVRKDLDPDHYSGLRGGFFWRDTLFHAWEKIGAQIEGVGSIAIRTAATMTYPKVHKTVPIEQLKKAYDDVADRRGFDPNIEPGFWIKPLVQTPTG